MINMLALTSSQTHAHFASTYSMHNSLTAENKLPDRKQTFHNSDRSNELKHISEGVQEKKKCENADIRWKFHLSQGESISVGAASEMSACFLVSYTQV